jgi:dephospho-CoA kinase
MLKVGLTGGIGSGKTVVAEVFRSLAIPVFSADEAAKVLMEEHPDIPRQLREATGKDHYRKGKLDRASLADQIFADPGVLQKVNQLVHPYVFQAFDQWAEHQYEHPYVLKEAAILFESGADEQLDLVISVTAPEHLRIRRVVLRDGVETEKVQQRMKNQWKDEARNRKADFVLFNGEGDQIIPQVLSIHEELLQQEEILKEED